MPWGLLAEPPNTFILRAHLGARAEVVQSPYAWCALRILLQRIRIVIGSSFEDISCFDKLHISHSVMIVLEPWRQWFRRQPIGTKHIKTCKQVVPEMDVPKLQNTYLRRVAHRLQASNSRTGFPSTRHKRSPNNRFLLLRYRTLRWTSLSTSGKPYNSSGQCPKRRRRRPVRNRRKSLLSWNYMERWTPGDACNPDP